MTTAATSSASLRQHRPSGAWLVARRTAHVANRCAGRHRPDASYLLRLGSAAASTVGGGDVMGPREAAVRRYYALVDGEDWLPLFELFDDDIVYRRPGYPPIRGLEAFKRFYTGTRVIATGQHTVRSLAEQADVVGCDGDFRGRLRNGDEVALRWADLWRFRADKVVERDTYFDAPLV